MKFLCKKAFCSQTCVRFLPSNGTRCIDLCIHFQVKAAIFARGKLNTRCNLCHCQQESSLFSQHRRSKNKQPASGVKFTTGSISRSWDS